MIKTLLIELIRTHSYTLFLSLCFNENTSLNLLGRFKFFFFYFVNKRGKYYLYIKESIQQQAQKPPKDIVYWSQGASYPKQKLYIQKMGKYHKLSKCYVVDVPF